jgi:tetratricopeptide (TPR) repeat protein
LERAINQSFSLLPSPFNTLVQRIYDPVSGSLQAKSSQVLDYINSVKNFNSVLQTQYSEVFERLARSSNNVGRGYYDAMMWYNNGLEFNKLGKNENAIVCYRKPIDINPQFAEAWNNLSAMVMRTGNYKLAFVFYYMAIAINPNFTLSQQNKLQVSNIIRSQNNQ